MYLCMGGKITMVKYGHDKYTMALCTMPCPPSPCSKFLLRLESEVFHSTSMNRENIGKKRIQKSFDSMQSILSHFLLPKFQTLAN